MPSTSTFCVCYDNIDSVELQLLVGYSISQLIIDYFDILIGR